MYVLDCRSAPPPPIPTVSSTSASTTATANRESVLARDRAARARRAFGSDLDHLTDADRDLIHAVTGEVLWPGRQADERPVSAFARQIAVDRRTGALPEHVQVDTHYLLRTRDVLDRLGATQNPFSGATLARALAYLERRQVGHIDISL